MTDAQTILELVGDACGEVVTLDTSLDELNLDSLDFVDLIRQCEISFQVTIPDSAIPAINTPSDILKAVRGV